MTEIGHPRREVEAIPAKPVIPAPQPAPTPAPAPIKEPIKEPVPA